MKNGAERKCGERKRSRRWKRSTGERGKKEVILSHDPTPSSKRCYCFLLTKNFLKRSCASCPVYNGKNDDELMVVHKHDRISLTSSHRSHIRLLALLAMIARSTAWTIEANTETNLIFLTWRRGCDGARVANKMAIALLWYFRHQCPSSSTSPSSARTKNVALELRSAFLCASSYFCCGAVEASTEVAVRAPAEYANQEVTEYWNIWKQISSYHGYWTNNK